MTFKINGVRLEVTTQTLNFADLYRFDLEVEGDLSEAKEFIAKKVSNIPNIGNNQIYDHHKPSFVKINGIHPNALDAYKRVFNTLKIRQEYRKLPKGGFVETITTGEKNFTGISILRGIKRFSKSLVFNNPSATDDNAKKYKKILQDQGIDTQHIPSTEDNYKFLKVLSTNLNNTLLINNAGITLRDLYFLKDDPESLGILLSHATDVTNLKEIGIAPKDLLLFKGTLMLNEALEILNVQGNPQAAQMINRVGLKEFAELARNHTKVFSTLVKHLPTVENIMKSGITLSTISKLGKETDQQYFESALKEYQGNWEKVKQEAIERSNKAPFIVMMRANVPNDAIRETYSFLGVEQKRRSEKPNSLVIS